MTEQRKTVSIVFADLVDSVSLAERLDPEVLANVLRRYFDALRLRVEAHGGSVEKFIGDAVVGVFGIPVVHEDDALRAVRSALEMHVAVARLTDELRPTLGVELAIRVGVNTGEVVASADNAMGHAISMAARLEQHAAAGDVLIGKQTHELVAWAAEAEPVADLAVKGSSQPLAAWRVTGIRASGTRQGLSGSPYIGRERELAAIADAYEQAVSTPTCVILTLIAPPGLGKSRLLAEATTRLSGNPRVVGGSCLPYGEGITYAPLVEAIRQLESEEGSGFVGRVMDNEPEGEEVVARVRATVDGAASGSPDETAWAFRRLFGHLSMDRPLVLVVDDLHWADALLLDLIEYVATMSAGCPVLLLCAARPDLLEARPAWSQMGPNSSQARLAPLNADEIQGLIAGLDGAELDQQTRRRIADAAGGVPLFVEQMAAFGAQVEGHRQVPPTIRALLAARIDHLTADERAVLERAAIQGLLFHRDALAALMPDEARAGVGAILISLVRRDFVQPQPAQNGRDAFVFSHALVRDAVYDAMPRRLRSDLHVQFAALLEARGAAPEEVVGYHLEQAYRERAALVDADREIDDLATTAGLTLAAAGRRAMARKEAARAIDLLSRAAELLSVAPAKRVTVLPSLIDAYIIAGDVAPTEALHGEAVELARSLGDVTSELRAEMAWAVGELSRDLGLKRQQILALCERAVNHFTAVRDDTNIAQALLLKGSVLAYVDRSDAIDALRAAHEHALRSGDERVQVETWDELGGAMLFGPSSYDETLDFVRREIEWAREHGIAFAVADGRLGEAYSMAALGNADEALLIVDELIALFSQLPSPLSQLGECHTLAGRIERDRGEPLAAERRYRVAMDFFDANGFKRWWRNAAPGAAHALVDLGRLVEAKALIDEMKSRADGSDSAPGSFQLEAEARYLALTGDATGGIALARRAVAAVAGRGAIQYEGRAHETLADLLRLAGDAVEAQREYALARSLYERKGYRPGVARIDGMGASRGAPPDTSRSSAG